MPPHRQRPFRLRDRAYQRAQGALIDNQFQRAAPQQSRNPFRRAGVAEVPAAHGLPGDMEIGRASCRESVCQYVSISVVAVALTTKKRKRKKNKKPHYKDTR